MTVARHQSLVTACRHDYLGDVDVPPRIDADIMRREKVSRGAGVVAAAPAGAKFSLKVKDAQTAAGRAWMSGRARPLAGAEAQFGHVYEIARNADLARPGHVGPLIEMAALRVEKLDSAIFAIRDVDSA